MSISEGNKLGPVKSSISVKAGAAGLTRSDGVSRDVLPPDLAGLAAGPLKDALAGAIALASATLSPRTEQAYTDAWAHFAIWCETNGAPHLPASPFIVAAYLGERSKLVGKSSLRITLSALAYYHRRSGHAWHSNHPVIGSVMKGILRRDKKPVRPAAALTSTEVRTLLQACGDDLAGTRDRAMLLTALAGGLRRSELVALDVGDIRMTRDGMVLRVQVSKTDQDGQGAEVGVAHGLHPETCPVLAMKTWLRRAATNYGPVFRRISTAGSVGPRLTAHAFWRVVKGRGGLSGIAISDGERLSPHGLRAGFISEAYLNGALDEQVMFHARQKSIATTRAYRQRAKVVQASPAKLPNL